MREANQLELQADAVIVGSGAAGGMAALELATLGVSSIVLEAGAWPAQVHGRSTRARAAQRVQSRCSECRGDLRELFVDDERNPYQSDREPFDWIRCRVVGGRTHAWNDVCLRLTEHELSGTRGGASGRWPIPPSQLRAAYRDVERLYRVRRSVEPANPAELRLLRSVRPAGLDIESTPFATNTAPGEKHATSLHCTLGPALSTGRVQVCTGAVAARVLTRRDGGAEAVEFVDVDSGARGVARGRLIVLAASTLESTRLLLNSSCSVHPRGIGGGTGLLGHYLADHVMLTGIKGARLSSTSAVYKYSGRGLRFTPTSADQSFQLQAYATADGELEQLELLGFGEAQSLYENRVFVDSEQLDSYGIPTLRIQHARQPADHALAEQMRRVSRQVMDHYGYQLLEPGSIAPAGLSVHEVGTVRMACEPEGGVVDHHGRVRGVPNLLVLDGAVFPRAGHSNPTLTIMALAKLACRQAYTDLRAA